MYLIQSCYSCPPLDGSLSRRLLLSLDLLILKVNLLQPFLIGPIFWFTPLDFGDLIAFLASRISYSFFFNGTAILGDR